MGLLSRSLCWSERGAERPIFLNSGRMFYSIYRLKNEQNQVWNTSSVQKFKQTPKDNQLLHFNYKRKHGPNLGPILLPKYTRLDLAHVKPGDQASPQATGTASRARAFERSSTAATATASAAAPAPPPAPRSIGLAGRATRRRRPASSSDLPRRP
jgi:hypothetical protein